MNATIDIFLILFLLIDLYLLGVSRLNASIKAVAGQGILLAIMPLVTGVDHTWHTWLLAITTLAIKGVVMPMLLFRAIREVNIPKEIEPYVGFMPSLLLGMVMVLTAFFAAGRLPLPIALSSRLWAPVALSAVMIGLFILVSRKKAVTQVLGYLVLENGIYVFALAIAAQMPFLVELGVLLDLLVGVFVMGIIINHIKDVFEDFDLDNLTVLKD
jgi:hydrogenase-4 component E